MTTKPILILGTLIFAIAIPRIASSRLPEEDFIKSNELPESFTNSEEHPSEEHVEEDSSDSAGDLTEVKSRSIREVVQDLFQETFYTLMEALSKSLSDLSARSRFRREVNSTGNSVGDEDTDYIFHSLSVGVGAFMDKQSCRRRLTCQATKIVKRNVPGLEMLVMLMDNVIPDSWVDWFSTIKSSAVDRNDRCSVDYDCDILPND